MENQIVNGRQAMIAAAGAYMRPLRKYSPQGHPLDLNAISFTFSKINPLKVKEGIDAAVNNFPM